MSLDFGTLEEAERCACWTVPGFADLSESSYWSPPFSLGAVGGDGRWYMGMFPNGERPEDEGHVSVCVGCLCVGFDVTPSSLRYKVSLLHDGHLTHTSPPTDVGEFLHKFVQRTEHLSDPGLLCNGQLKVHAKVWPADTPEPSCHHQTQQNTQSGPSDSHSEHLLASATQNLADTSAGGSQRPTNDSHFLCFKMWYQKTDLTDTTVKVNDKQYRVHKFVLASRSPVFHTMITQEMSESITDSLDVTDMTAEGFGHLLEYMYTGNVTDLNNFAAELLDAAEKYELDGLKAMCVASLHKSISADTVLDTLILADLYRAPNLKIAALELIKRQGHAVTSSEGWKRFLTGHPELATEVFQYLLPTNTTI